MLPSLKAQSHVDILEWQRLADKFIVNIQVLKQALYLVWKGMQGVLGLGMYRWMTTLMSVL